MKGAKLISPERLRHLLYYNPSTGLFIWRVSRRGHARAGMSAGSFDQHGYRRIKIDGRVYLAHRLAWLYMTDEWPNGEIDHINRTPGDDRFTNLREATRSENQRNTNMSRRNTSGTKGVFRHKFTTKWRAAIGINGRQIHLGYFEKKADARAAYLDAAEKYHGKFVPEET